MKKLLHISLIVLLSGMPALFAQNLFETNCCHSTKEEKAEKDSCCMMQEEPKEEQSCSMFELNSSSLDNCGCIHDYISVEESILINPGIDFSKTLVEIDTDLSPTFDHTLLTQVYSTRISCTYKVPIYISVSSYLI